MTGPSHAGLDALVQRSSNPLKHLINGFNAAAVDLRYLANRVLLAVVTVN